MVRISTCIYHQNQPSVGNCTIHGWYGNGNQVIYLPTCAGSDMISLVDCEDIDSAEWIAAMAHYFHGCAMTHLLVLLVKHPQW